MILFQKPLAMDSGPWLGAFLFSMGKTDKCWVVILLGFKQSCFEKFFNWLNPI